MVPLCRDVQHAVAVRRVATVHCFSSWIPDWREGPFRERAVSEAVGRVVQLFALYQKELRRVVKLMHRTGVARMDLLPCNIAWRRAEGYSKVEVRLIDFDASCPVNKRVETELFSVMCCRVLLAGTACAQGRGR